ncbi:glutamine amidotransferase, class-ii [hydrocarbon metagenome]|uniref:Glutamine amidotransferase, class-ii n=1 Tax=hydrocarbon metagenome TaxID=938273 RepID=A0A0W8FJF5_9ZZZZ
MDGSGITSGLSMMDERGSGEGAGYAGYGIYPEYRDCYALHVFFDDIEEKKGILDKMLEKRGSILHEEEIPTREQPNLKKIHTPWRYFFKPDAGMTSGDSSEDDVVASIVMEVNAARNGSLIVSSGKNMGVFKAAGRAREVADFYGIEEYEAYTWLGHNLYTTNNPGWWGGAHPFNLLDRSIVLNGGITSGGTNRRYVESFGYRCTMDNDTEVIAYLIDLLVRKHGLTEDLAIRALAPPFWDDIDRMPQKERELNRAIRLTYGSAMMNGPIAIVAANHDGMIGCCDRIKLRPLVVGEHGDRLCISSEEAAIRAMDPDIDRTYMAGTDAPVIGRFFA